MTFGMMRCRQVSATVGRRSNGGENIFEVLTGKIVDGAGGGQLNMGALNLWPTSISSMVPWTIHQNPKKVGRRKQILNFNVKSYRGGLVKNLHAIRRWEIGSLVRQSN